MQSQPPNDPTPKPSRRRFIESAGAVTGAAFAGAAIPGRATAAQSSGSDSPGARFRGLLGGDDPPYCVNCGDVATARLAEMHGFQIVMTGAAPCP